MCAWQTVTCSLLKTKHFLGGETSFSSNANISLLITVICKIIILVCHCQYLGSWCLILICICLCVLVVNTYVVFNQVSNLVTN